MRDNQTQLTAPPSQPIQEQEKQPSFQDFPSSTSILELPSAGQYYPEHHAFHNQKEIEIKFMTAKEEDILTTKHYMKKGIVLDKLIESVLLQNVSSRSLLESDRLAIIIEARKTGFGSEYRTKCFCKNCQNQTEVEADLEKDLILNEKDVSKNFDVEHVDESLFSYTLDKGGLNAAIEFRLLNGHDDNQLFLSSEKQRKNKNVERNFSDRLSQMIVSINGNDDRKYINMAIHRLPLIYAKELQEAYRAVSPSIKIVTDYECDECDFVGSMEVPISLDFFRFE